MPATAARRQLFNSCVPLLRNQSGRAGYSLGMTRETRDDVAVNAGAATDQHITGHDESGTFLTDQPPTSATPATGSSNAGINKLRGNQAEDQPGDNDDRQG